MANTESPGRRWMMTRLKAPGLRSLNFCTGRKSARCTDDGVDAGWYSHLASGVEVRASAPQVLACGAYSEPTAIGRTPKSRKDNLPESRRCIQ
jgi:hypothetical protein